MMEFSDIKLKEKTADGLWIWSIRKPDIAKLTEIKVIGQSYLLHDTQYELLCKEKKDVLSYVETKFQVKGSPYQLPLIGDIPVVFQVNPLTSISCVVNSDPDNIPVDSLISVDRQTPQSTSDKTIKMYTMEKYQSHVVPEIKKQNTAYSFEKCLEIILENGMFPHTIGISIPNEISVHLVEFCQNILTAVKDLPQNYERPIYILLFVKTSKMMTEMVYILKTPSLLLESDEIPLDTAQEECTVDVITGLITEQEVDVVVNSTDKNLLLSVGTISSSILNAAGPELNRECTRKFPTGLIFPEIAITNGYNLPCNYVFHGAVPHNNGHPNIFTFVENCLQKATEIKLSSIAFPALGTGSLNYKPQNAAAQMAAAIKEFKAKTHKSSLKKIIIVIYPYTQGMNDFFELNKTFGKAKDSKGAVPKRKPESPLQKEQKQAPNWIYKQLQWIQFFSLATKRKTLDDAIKELEKYLMEPSLKFRKNISATPDRFNQNKQKSSEFFGATDITSSYLEPEKIRAEPTTVPSSYLKPENIRAQPVTVSSSYLEPERNRSFVPSLKKNEDINTFKIVDGFLVKVYLGDILNVDVDGIVNAANRWLRHSGGIARAIIDAAGDAVNREGQEKLDGGILNDGEVLSTSAGNLKRYKHIIHAVGPIYTSTSSKEYCKRKVADAVYNSLTEANRLGLGSVALPAISSAIFGVPLDVCTSGYFMGVKEFCQRKTPNCQLKEVHFIDLNPETYKAIKDYFAKQVNEAPMETTGNNIHQPKDNSLNIPNQGKPEDMEVDPVDDQNVTCFACKKSVHQSMIQKKCEHIFCTHCIEKPCSLCHKTFDIVYGNHPSGIMDVSERSYSRRGFSNTIQLYEIHYRIYSSAREGQLITGTAEWAYLPVTEEGTTILKMLQLAFERYLIFRVGKNERFVSWADIPHKTNLYGSLEKNGCLDPNYLNEVKARLAAKGITPEVVAGRQFKTYIILQ